MQSKGVYASMQPLGKGALVKLHMLKHFFRIAKNRETNKTTTLSPSGMRYMNFGMSSSHVVCCIESISICH